MTRYVYVEHQITVLKLDLTNGTAFHEPLSCDRVAGAHLPHHLHGRVIGLRGIVGHGRGVVMKVWMAHVILGIEMDLGAMEVAAVGGLCFPLAIVVVVLVVIYGWWGIVGDQALLRRLAVRTVRIVVPLVGHGGETRDGSRR